MRLTDEVLDDLIFDLRATGWEHIIQQLVREYRQMYAVKKCGICEQTLQEDMAMCWGCYEIVADRAEMYYRLLED